MPMATSRSGQQHTRTRSPSWLAVLAALAFTAGCTTPMDARKDRQYQERAPIASRPVVRPVRSVSSFSESLMCMDRMLRAAEVPTTLITSKQFVDFSGKVPAATKEMVVTALSQMSRVSNAFRFVDFEVDIARQDTVQNLTTILLNNNQMQLQRPALYVSGAIAFVDQGVINNSFDAGISGPRVDLGYSQSRNATVVALEVHLGDFRTRTIIPGLDSANEVIVGSGGQGVDLGGRIGEYGVRFNVGRDYAIGTGAALRTLVDLSMIELVGKWARLPYWQCLTLDQSHPQFQRQMHDWYLESGHSGQSQLLRSSLVTRGYLPQDASDRPVTDPLVRDALARFQADRGIPVSGTIDFQTYEAALGNFVSLAEDGSLARVGWAATGTVTTAQTSADGKLPPLQVAAQAPWSIDLQIENPQPAGERPAFTEGEQVFLSATVTRASHLYCYFADSSGGIMRLLPNLLQPHSLVSANQAVRIPDWMAPNPGFILDAGKPGQETVMCLATRDDVLPKLPPSMQGAALAPLRDVGSLEELQQHFDAAAGSAGMVTRSVQWKVAPAAPAPAAAR
ncbi:putative peptidoglycan binding protein [Melaminivora alkalimesophila]|uniref:Putative peptidoglycan binding protein n=2 Tax=Melaminivora alkalimesophila TaxID=1165852 RepID=A0A317RKV8_9BURK|nr:putative peptidoglycan binding protein [Melaminivora alkalimesophila]